MLKAVTIKALLTKLALSILGTLALSACSGGNSDGDTPPLRTPSPTLSPTDIDLASVSPEAGLIRLYGSDGTGNLGVPVAGGFDMNGDGYKDYAMAAMRASPENRDGAGQVYLALGNGAIDYSVNSGEEDDRLLTFIGAADREAAGSEIWMGDVTGDGLGDLLIARQNYRLESPQRVGAGALSIVIGNNAISGLASDDRAIELRNPPAGLRVLTLVGAEALDRLGIWMRVGDITGDGIDDIAVGADQADVRGANSGVVYIIRGGEHLNTSTLVDLNNIAASEIAGHIATILPPANANGYHFGATLNVADLDGNGRAEVIVAATINRAGASITAQGAPGGSAQASGGFPGGRFFILWDDNFSGDWPAGYTVSADDSAPGSISDIRGGSTASYQTANFGEELLGGLDYNGDGAADLFVGDISGNTADFASAGLGFVFFNAATLKDQSFAINSRPADIAVSTIFGPATGAIAGDTALHGDFDNDGIDDLAIASPQAAPMGRISAGIVHVLWGKATWPTTINLENSQQPAQDSFAITNILGANGTQGGDVGDTLGYSAAAGDLDGDGFVDLIVNEMLGNGISPGSQDAGNLIVLSGGLLASKR